MRGVLVDFMQFKEASTTPLDQVISAVKLTHKYIPIKRIWFSGE